jgi:flagellar protein FliO/FliZ
LEPGDVTSLALMIGLIALLLWGALWALRRLRPAAAGGGDDCAVLRSLALGPRERLLVVRVGKRDLVIGVGAASVSLLCELDEPLPDGTSAGAKFSAAIGKAMGQWHGV